MRSISVPHWGHGRVLVGVHVPTIPLTCPRHGPACRPYSRRRVLDRPPVPRPPGNPVACSRSPTAAAPTTPTSRAWRTPCRRSGTPSTLGYRYLETDVHVTRDGVLLAFHDSVLDRVTDGTGRIADSDLRRGAARPDRRLRAVPTLAELLDEFPGARFNIDLKARRRGRAAGAVRRGARGRGTGSGRFVLAVAGCDGSAGSPAAGSRPRHRPAEVAAFRFAPRPGSPARLHARTTRAALQVPHQRGRLTIVTPGLVRRAHAGRRPRARLDRRRPRRDDGAARPSVSTA